MALALAKLANLLRGLVLVEHHVVEHVRAYALHLRVRGTRFGTDQQRARERRPAPPTS
jgi:hypothetical protein